jgi:hypothetical protein
MRWSADRCIGCGSPVRRTFTPCLDEDIVDKNGLICGAGPFWFCSNECIQKVINSYVSDKKYCFGRTAYDDPSIPDYYIEEWVERWERSRNTEINKAILKFFDHLDGEQEQYYAKLRIEAQREEDRKKLTQQRELDQWSKVIAAATTKEEKERERRDKERKQQQEREEKEAEKREREYQSQKKHKEIIEQRDRQRRERMEQTDQYRREQQLRDQRREEQRELDRLQSLQDKENERYDRMRADAEGEHRAFLHREQQEIRDAKAREELIASRQVPQRLRNEHTHILGPSGSGKSSLILDIYFHDIWDYDHNRFNADIPAYIIIDPKGTLVEKLARLQMFGPGSPLRDRLVIVDPFERPALNIFQTTGNNSEQISSLFSYIFSTGRQQLTGQQDTCFSFCVDVMMQMPGVNLFTLLDFLDDATERGSTRDPRFQVAIAQLTNPAARKFFQSDYYSPTYAPTRQQIKTRIWQVVHNEHLAAMFNAPERKLDIAKCIRDRKTVLVNTQMVKLKRAHQTLGRYIIALAADAIQSRPLDSHAVYVVIDEYQEFADADKVPEMLRLIREYNGGAVLAHHNMFCAEFNETGNADAIRAVISTNTQIKYASKPGATDIGYVVKDMQCDSEFLVKKCIKDDIVGIGRFGCMFRGLDHPFIYEFPFDEIDQWPSMSDADYHKLREANKKALQ